MITKKGTVIKNSSNKTLKVEIKVQKTHPKYKKQYTETTRFLVHDEENKATVGDQVVIRQVPPKSKRKSWEVTSILKAA